MIEIGTADDGPRTRDHWNSAGRSPLDLDAMVIIMRAELYTRFLMDRAHRSQATANSRMDAQRGYVFVQRRAKEFSKFGLTAWRGHNGGGGKQKAEKLKN